MRAIAWLGLVFGGLAALLFMLPAWSAGPGDESVRANDPAVWTGHEQIFYDEATFLEAVRAAERMQVPEGDVVAGIIPHHWLAGHLITAFFRGLAEHDPPSTVILIGPNHENAGRARALTSDLPWSTAFGPVEPEIGSIDALVDAGLAAIEPAVLTPEHSVAGIMPAIAYYLPDARVVPLILSGEMTPDETETLAAALVPYLDDDTVLVAAVDFSHYLVASQAERNDQVTLSALRSLDADALFRLDNGYLDSPPSIAVLLQAVSDIGARDFVLLENTNSGAIAGDQLSPTTSYFLGYFPEP